MTYSLNTTLINPNSNSAPKNIVILCHGYGGDGKDISVLNDNYGKPNYEISTNVKKLIYLKFNVRKIKISLSLADEKNYSIAFSVIHK